jgi:predicted metal-binding membrane protein
VFSAASVAALPRRGRILISTCIALITALAWAYLIHLDRQMASAVEYDKAMAAMGMTTHGPWTAADAFFTFAMWAIMMVGMMAVSAAPMILLFAAAQAKRGQPGASPAVIAFGFGYFVIWAGFSACATIAQWALHRAAMLSPAMAASSSRLGGILLIVAGLYQLTPWKGACLRHCRGPLGFLMTHWRDGTFGAFQMGLHHGVHCLGCCWALMAVLFVVGVMNLVWVAALTVFVLLEKFGPAGRLVARFAGVAMGGLGAYLILTGV